jgi:hypothetical protein
MRLLPRLTLALLPALLGAALAFHFATTLAYLTPLNPWKLSFYQLVNSYMHPLFVQNWHLFAPDPVRDTRVLTVSCRLRQPDGSLIETPWVDVSTPFRQARQANRITPADRMDRPQSSAMHALFSRDETLLLLQKHRRDEDADSGYDRLLEELGRGEARQREGALTVLNRIASAHCDSLHGAGRTVEVRPRIVVLQYPRFSERHRPDADGELTYHLLDWAPYQAVAPLTTKGG